MPSMTGAPTLISLPSLNSRTRPSVSDEPGSAVRRSTRIRSPGATRYCFPPLTTTAEREPSGLGTASDCTSKLLPSPRRGERWGEGDGTQSPLEKRSPDQHHQHQRRIRRNRPLVQSPRRGHPPPSQHGAGDNHQPGHRSRDAEETQQPHHIVAGRRKEQRCEQSAVGEPAQAPLDIKSPALPPLSVGRRRPQQSQEHREAQKVKEPAS